MTLSPPLVARRVIGQPRGVVQGSGELDAFAAADGSSGHRDALSTVDSTSLHGLLRTDARELIMALVVQLHTEGGLWH